MSSRKDKEAWWNESYNEIMSDVPASISDKIFRAVGKMVKRGEVTTAKSKDEKILEVIIKNKKKYEKAKETSRENSKILKTAKVIIENVLPADGNSTIINLNQVAEEGDQSLEALSSKLLSIKDIEVDLTAKIQAASSRKAVLFSQLEEEKRGLSQVQNKLNEVLANKRVIEAKISKELAATSNFNHEYSSLIEQRENEIMRIAKENIRNKIDFTPSIKIREKYEAELNTLRKYNNELRAELKSKTFENAELHKIIKSREGELLSKDAVIDICLQSNKIEASDHNEQNTKVVSPRLSTEDFHEDIQPKKSAKNRDMIKGRNKNITNHSQIELLENDIKKAIVIKRKDIKDMSLTKEHSELYDDIIEFWKLLTFLNIVRGKINGSSREIYSCSDLQNSFSENIHLIIDSLKIFNAANIADITPSIESKIDWESIIREVDNFYKTIII